MSTSYSYSETETFSTSHARHIGAKVSADLLRFQNFYRDPSNKTIDAYEAELVALIKEDYLAHVTYGFQRHEQWVIAVRYVSAGGVLVPDQDPGSIKPGVDVTGADFTSFLVHNGRWHSLTATQQQAFKAGLPFTRGYGAEPGIENGYWAEDRSYSAGGRGISRSQVKRYS